MPFDLDNDIDFDADKVDVVQCAQNGHDPRQVAYMPFDIDNNTAIKVNDNDDNDIDIDFDADKDLVQCAQSGHDPRQVAYMTLTSPLSSNLTLSLTLTRSHTHLLMEFGHFLAHDISLTSQAELDCCSPEVRVGMFTMMIKPFMRITMAIAFGNDEEAEP